LATICVLVGGLVFAGAPALAAAPEVLSEGVSSITPYEAHLEATVNAGEETTKCHFQYGTTSITEHEAACEPSETLEGGEQGVGLAVGGLDLGTTYHYRVLVKNATSEVEGAGEFTTLGTAPLVSTGAVSEIGQSSANVTGSVTPEGAETHYYYQYGPTTEYGQRTASSEPGVNVGAGLGSIEAPATLVPLTPDVSYHYRLVAWNEYGTSYGQDGTFTTEAGQSPLAVPGPASGISVNEATISDPLVNPTTPPLIATPNIAFPKEEKAAATTTKTLTRAQKLSKARKTCRKSKSLAKRAGCEAKARRQYGPVEKTKKK
jgi:hypothetical protein